MKPQSEEARWKQHYPTYHFAERDIALEEYRSATKILEAEERVFLNAANISIVVGAGFGSLALGSMDKITQAFSPAVPKIITLFFCFPSQQDLRSSLCAISLTARERLSLLLEKSSY